MTALFCFPFKATIGGSYNDLERLTGPGFEFPSYHILSDFARIPKAR